MFGRWMKTWTGVDVKREAVEVDYDRVEQALKKSLSNDNEPQWMAVTLTVLTLNEPTELATSGAPAAPGWQVMLLSLLSVWLIRITTNRYCSMKCTRRLCDIHAYYILRGAAVCHMGGWMGGQGVTYTRYGDLLSPICLNFNISSRLFKVELEERGFETALEQIWTV